MALNSNVISADDNVDSNGNPIPVTTPAPTQNAIGGSVDQNSDPDGSTPPDTQVTPAVTQAPSLINQIQTALTPAVSPAPQPSSAQTPLTEGIGSALSSIQPTPAPTPVPTPVPTPAPTANPLLTQIQSALGSTVANQASSTFNPQDTAGKPVIGGQGSIPTPPVTTPVTTPTPVTGLNNVFNNTTPNGGVGINDILTAIKGNVQETSGQANQDANNLAQNPAALANFRGPSATPTVPVTQVPMAAEILQDYEQYLGRVPNQSELQYYIQQAANGITPDQIKQEFLNSPEYDAKNGITPPITSATTPIVTPAPTATIPSTVTDSNSAISTVQKNIAQMNSIIKNDPTLSNPADVTNIQTLVAQSTAIANKYATGQDLTNTLATLNNYTNPANAETTAQWASYVGTAPTPAQVTAVQSAVAAGQTPQQAMDALVPLNIPPAIGPSSSANYGTGSTSAAAGSPSVTSSLGIPSNSNPFVALGSNIAGGLAGSIAGTAIGSAIGGTLLGFEAGSVLGPIGALAGAVIATVITSFFGPKPSVGPNVTADVTGWDTQTNAPTTITSEDNGGDASIGTKLATAGGASVGALINSMGGTVTGYPPIQIGYYKGKYFVGDGSSGATYENNQFTDVNAAMADFMYRSIRNIVQANGVSGLTKSQQQALLNLTPQTISTFQAAQSAQTPSS